jgi:hypothetical protein
MTVIDAQLAVPMCAGVVLGRRLSTNRTNAALSCEQYIKLFLRDSVPVLEPKIAPISCVVRRRAISGSPLCFLVVFVAVPFSRSGFAAALNHANLPFPLSVVPDWVLGGIRVLSSIDVF